MRNWDDNGQTATEHGFLVQKFLAAHDFSIHTRRAFSSDLEKFANWFSVANAEKFDLRRIAQRDVIDYRNHLRRDRRQSVATVNRNLVTLRRFLGWLVREGHLEINAAQAVKELAAVRLAPVGLERADVRRLMREAELRGDARAAAIFGLLVYSGARVSDLTGLELGDLHIGQRSGHATFRCGKGNKERTVPLPLSARQSISAYLSVRPPTDSPNVFQGERGPLTPQGVRHLFRTYSALTGLRLHPHLLRHTFAHNFLATNQNDLVSLSQLLGHQSVNTSARYAQRSSAQLASAVEQMVF